KVEKGDTGHDPTYRRMNARGVSPTWRRNMKRIRIIGIMAVLALIAAACSPDTADSTTTSQAADTTTTAPPSGDTTTTTDNGDEEPDDNPLAEWGENP